MRTLAAPVGDSAVFVGLLVKRERVAVDRIGGVADRLPSRRAVDAPFLRVVGLEHAHAAHLAVGLPHDVLVPSVLKKHGNESQRNAQQQLELRAAHRLIV